MLQCLITCPSALHPYVCACVCVCTLGRWASLLNPCCSANGESPEIHPKHTS